MTLKPDLPNNYVPLYITGFVLEPFHHSNHFRNMSRFNSNAAFALISIADKCELLWTILKLED